MAVIGASGPFTRRRLAEAINTLKSSLDSADLETAIDTLQSDIDDGTFGKLATLGVEVQRATAALPASTAGALFTIAGGRVLVTALVGEVTTVIQTQANATKIVYNPTATGASTDLCTTLDITADAVGTYYSLPAAVGSALVSSLLYASVPDLRLVLEAGTIDLDCAATNTGSVAWSVFYVPIDDGATIVAA